MLRGNEFRSILKLVMVFLLYSSALFAQKSKPLSLSDSAGITSRGRMLAEYDNASWRATDVVVALKPVDGTVSKYIARKTTTGWVVVFGKVNDASNAFLIAYEATEGNNAQQFNVKRYDPPEEDTGFYYFAARGIGAALQNFHGENRPYNTYVLPADSKQFYVYVVPAQTIADVYPLGGDVRYLLSADGATIIETRQMHKGILEIKVDNSKTLAAGYHTHVVTDVPEDTDVFHVLRRNPPVPEYIGTKTGLYVVQVDGTLLRQK